MAPEAENLKMLRDMGRELIDGEPMLAPASSEGDQVTPSPKHRNTKSPFPGYGYALLMLPVSAMC